MIDIEVKFFWTFKNIFRPKIQWKKNIIHDLRIQKNNFLNSLCYLVIET